MTEAFTGAEGIGRALEAGKDPNADLDGPIEKGDSKTRAQAAVTMRIAGASFTEIAQTLGYSSAYNARAAIERVLADAAEDTTEVGKLRELHRMRLNRLLKSVMPKALNPKLPPAEHLAYHARALAILDRQARLDGLDAPTQTVVHTPDAARVQEWLARVVPVLRSEATEIEVEIIEADLDEGV